MRIVILRLNSGNFGKVGTYNVQEIGLANVLISMGFMVDVLFLHRKVKKIEDDEKYAFVHYLPHISFGLHGLFKVRLIEKYKPNIIIMWSDNQLWAKNVIYWCKKRNVKVIHYFGGVLSNNSNFLNQLYTKAILLRNKKSYKYSINCAKTEAVKKEMVDNGIACEKVINIGLDTKILSNKKSIDLSVKTALGYSSRDKLVLFIGRMSSEKKPIEACEIIKELHKHDLNYKMIMIGDGSLTPLVDEYINKNHLNNLVNHIKRVPYEDISNYIVSSDCFINLSEIEIFGMAILESMYYGTPIVVQSAPGPNEYVVDGFNGYKFDEYNAIKVAELVEDAIKNKEKVIHNARKTIIDHYNWDSIADSFIELFSK